jgi:hypothetical protein
MLVSCVGSAGGRSSAEDEEESTEGEASDAESEDSASDEGSKE